MSEVEQPVLITVATTIMELLRDGSSYAKYRSPEELRSERSKALEQWDKAHKVLGLPTPPFDFSARA